MAVPEKFCSHVTDGPEARNTNAAPATKWEMTQFQRLSRAHWFSMKQSFSNRLRRNANSRFLARQTGFGAGVPTPSKILKGRLTASRNPNCGRGGISLANSTMRTPPAKLPDSF